MKPVFFAKPSEFFLWLKKHHDNTRELWVGFHKKHSGRPSITWPESVNAALCFGWIDGIRKSIDETSYAIRFTPRKPRSTWSNVNIKRARELVKLGLMRPEGLAAFRRRTQERSGTYTYEQKTDAKLDRNYETKMRNNKNAWQFFQKQAPWYRKTAIRWVMSAKQEETRLRRLTRLIEDSENGRSITPLARPK